MKNIHLNATQFAEAIASMDSTCKNCYGGQTDRDGKKLHPWQEWCNKCKLNALLHVLLNDPERRTLEQAKKMYQEFQR